MSKPRWWMVIAVMVWLTIRADASIYPVGVKGQTLASAVCVGTQRTEQGRMAVFLTNKHVVRSVQQLVVGGEDDKWHRASRIRVAERSNTDVASFEVPYQDGLFQFVALMTNVPDGTQAKVCGYSDRREFCLAGVMRGDELLANGRHVIPGDSGGGVLVAVNGQKYLAGLTWAYDTQRRNSLFVPTSQCCDHLYRIYSKAPRCTPFPRAQRQQQNCPDNQCPLPQGSYRRYERQEPRFLAPPRIERYEEYESPEVVEPPPEPVPQISESDLRRIVVSWLEQNRDTLQGQDGTNGRDGQDAANISVAEIGAYIAANHMDQLRGPVGATGPAGSQGSPGQQGLPGESGRDGKDGARGLVGVPDEADIRNWLVGAASDPQTRQMLATLLANLVAADPRVDALIQRLDQLEQQSPTDVTSIAQRVDDVEARLTSVVPVRILNNDGSVFSADEERRALDPIEFKLLPPDKGE